ncbi:hypothetical protein [uncultured Campylobacter sp.]|uniref:hypothetical protein n=1 Tax=uncultured Campylobacter sp. TaxID=218934 RepID=UPI00260B91AB|nr:hypothetical protein [uncultured Campylobacter sp.]
MELTGGRLAAALRVAASRTIASHAVLRLPHATALRALKFEILKFHFLISRFGILRRVKFRAF